MGKETGISWTDSTWNLFRGCSREIADGAETSGCGDQTGGGCYAERDGGRFCGPGGPYEGLVRITPTGARWTGQVRIVAGKLLDPIRWRTPSRIFTTSVSDPYHPRFSNEEIAGAFGIMAVSHWHTHQLLTKRARRMRSWFEWMDVEAANRGMSPAWMCIELARQLVDRHVPNERKTLERAIERAPASSTMWPLPNLWLGISAEHQPAYNDRWPHLRACPAAVRMISAEPLIGEIELVDAEGLGWLIAGCESGDRARPALAAWFRRLRDECAGYGIPFFLKQAVADAEAITVGPGSTRKRRGLVDLPYLDDVQHGALPVVSRAV